MGRYGSAIYGTRPWRIHGEGPVELKAGMFANNGTETPFTAADIRYVRRGKDVHALVLGWPQDNVARLKLWSRNNPIGRGEVSRITLPGQKEPLTFRRTDDALEVDLPPVLRHRIGVALILSGQGLTQGSSGDYGEA